MRNIKARFNSVIAYLIFAATAAPMLLISWRRWPDILIDFGRELYVPWQISNGAVLYRDIAYLNGPLASCVNAILFKIFGVSLTTLVFFNIFLIVLLTVLIYKIFNIIADKMTALAAGIAFLTLFAFSQYVITGNYNFVCPYSHDLTQGIVLSFIALYVFALYVKSKKMGWLSLMGLLVGLIFLTKMEVFLAIALALSSGIAAFFITERMPLSRIVQSITLMCGVAVLPLFFFSALFLLHMPLRDIFSAFTTSYSASFNPEISSNLFYRAIMGLDTPKLNIIKFAYSSIWYIVVVTTLGAIGIIMARVQGRISRIFSSLAGILLIFVLPLFLIDTSTWLDYGLRGLPLAMTLLLGYAIYSIYVTRCIKQCQELPRLLVLLSLTLFGLVLLLKIFLNVHIYHYGFALAMPATLLLVMIFSYLVPALFEKVAGSSIFLRYAGMALVAAFILAHIAQIGHMYSFKTYPVGSGKDLILTYRTEVSPKGAVLNSALNKIKEEVKNGSSLSVMPEGAMLNYLLRIKNPTPYIMVMPPEVRFFGQGRILKAFDESAPDYVVIIDHDISEYGFNAFGNDYGSAIQEWVNKNYASKIFIRSPQSSDKKFGMVLLKKK